MSAPRVRIAVIGVGHLGKSHARLLAAIPGAELVGVVDVREDVAKAVAEQWGVAAATDPTELPADWQLDAVAIVTPTVSHFELARLYMSRGLDVLIEKPITSEVAQALELCELAERDGRILQVGHVERFNPVIRALREFEIEPRYIECDRLAPFSFRSTDIGVVLDLMIHDIDVIQSLVASPVADVEAFGGAIFTPAEDLASARVRFENGCIARLSANRVALKPSRRMRMFSRESYVSLDFGKKYGLIIKKAPGWDLQQLDLASLDTENIQDLWKFVFEGLLEIRELSMDETNPLEDELEHFLHCVRTRETPEVDGRAGLRALETAHLVLASIATHEW